MGLADWEAWHGFTRESLDGVHCSASRPTLVVRRRTITALLAIVCSFGDGRRTNELWILTIWGLFSIACTHLRNSWIWSEHTVSYQERWEALAIPLCASLDRFSDIGRQESCVMLRNYEKRLYRQICSNLKKMKGFLLCEKVNSCWRWMDQNITCVRQNVSSLASLAAGSLLKSRIESVLFFFSWTIVRENKALNGSGLKTESKTNPENRRVSCWHATTRWPWHWMSAQWFSQQANWFTLFIWGHSRVCSQSRLILFLQHQNPSLHLASQTGDEELVVKLIAEGADVNLEDKVLVFDLTTPGFEILS